MKKIIIFAIFFSFLDTFFFDLNFAKASEDLAPIYSFWNKTDSYRYLTISESDKKSLSSNKKWTNEGTFGYTYSTKKEGTVPVYKIKNEKYRYYLYTTLESTKDRLLKSRGWAYKGIAFYAYNEKKEVSSPVYSLANSKNRKYFYTSNIKDKEKLLANSLWIDKGISFWFPKENTEATETTVISDSKISYGPEISVGLWKTSRADAEENSFKISADKNYVIKDAKGKIIKEISAGSTTRVKYAGDKNFLVYKSLNDVKMEKEVLFEAKNANDKNSIVFDVSRPSSPYDHYRGKIKIRYSDTSKEIWVINILPMEQYVWGMGETTGTGAFEHTKVMTTIFRTYGYWYIEYATKYLPYGFKIKSDAGSQIYRGYDWEIAHPNIKKAASETEGVIAMYKDEIALTPYSSWSDGKTRSFKERWGSSDYPWCKSVKDPYGKHPSMSTKQLEAAGNHMVGLVGYGSVKLADKYKWSYKKIMSYYYTGISLKEKY